MKEMRYVVIHVVSVNIVGVYPASTKKEARKIQEDLRGRENWSAYEAESAWIWNIRTNEQDP
jgi:hypothetical protein